MNTKSYLGIPGETSKLVCAKDWASTDLGPMDSWSKVFQSYLSLILSSRIPMYIIWGNNYNFIYNDAYLPLIGELKHPQGFGNKFDLVWHEVWSQLKPLVESVYAGQSAHFTKHPLVLERKGHKEEAYFDFSFSPLRDENNNINGLLCTCMEATLEVNAVRASEEIHKKLKVSEEQLSFAVSSAKVGFYDWDIQQNVVIFSDQMQSDWGIKAGSSFEEVAFRIHPDDREKTKNLIGEAIQNGLPYSTEYRVIRPDDVEVWIEAKGQVTYDSARKPLRFFGTSQDITQRKAIEIRLAHERHKLEQVFQESPAAMALWVGRDLIFEKVNPEYQAIFGNRQLLGQPFLSAVPEIQGQGFEELLWEVMDTGKPFIGKEILAKLKRSPDGPIEDCYYNFSYVRVCDSEGNPYGVYDHAVDVTDQVMNRKRLEESEAKYKALAEELAQAVKTRDEFLSIASHELKTPLTSVKLQTQLAKRNIELHRTGAFDPTKITKFVNLTDRSVDRLTSLVDDMLDISRIASGKLILNPEKFDLCQLAQEVLERFHPQAALSDVELTLTGGAPVVGFWDRFRIDQVLSNLISNALKYGQGSPINVSVNLSDSKDKAICKVSDEGPGISQENQQRIFNRFERAVGKNSASGLGLGLHISKEIIDRHAGNIFVISNPGDGATFVAELPLTSDFNHSTGQQ